MAKVAKNLSLDEEAIRRAEAYSERHHTSVSALVNEFLCRLPLEAQPIQLGEDELSPTVRRLLGVASGKHDAGSYHDYLNEKYG